MRYLNINTIFDKNKLVVVFACINKSGKLTVKVFKNLYWLLKWSREMYGSSKLEESLIEAGFKAGDFCILTNQSTHDYYDKFGNPFSTKGWYLKIPKIILKDYPELSTSIDTLASSSAC
jgi:hypothetical protein